MEKIIHLFDIIETIEELTTVGGRQAFFSLLSKLMIFIS